MDSVSTFPIFHHLFVSQICTLRFSHLLQGNHHTVWVTYVPRVESIPVRSLTVSQHAAGSLTYRTHEDAGPMECKLRYMCTMGISASTSVDFVLTYLGTKVHSVHQDILILIRYTAQTDTCIITCPSTTHGSRSHNVESIDSRPHLCDIMRAPARRRDSCIKLQWLGESQV